MGMTLVVWGGWSFAKNENATPRRFDEEQFALICLPTFDEMFAPPSLNPKLTSLGGYVLGLVLVGGSALKLMRARD
jgi:hypothetical protein